MNRIWSPFIQGIPLLKYLYSWVNGAFQGPACHTSQSLLLQQVWQAECACGFKALCSLCLRSGIRFDKALFLQKMIML